MTVDFFDLTLELATELGGLFMGVAESGTTTTIVDTTIPGSDDDYNDGTVWLETGDNAGNFSVVTDFVASSGTITIEDTQSNAVSAGDDFTLAKPMFPLSMLKSAINRELNKIKIPQVDTSSVTIADEQTEYSLPAAVHDLREVYIQRVDDDADDNRWVPINWDVEISTTGSANTLILDRQFSSDYDLKLVYVINHPRLYDSTDQLNERIEPQRIIPGAVVNCLIQRFRFAASGNDFESEMINQYRQEREIAKREYPIRLPPVQGRVMTAHHTFDPEDQIGDI